jgi:hypothetical protein
LKKKLGASVLIRFMTIGVPDLRFSSGVVNLRWSPGIAVALSFGCSGGFLDYASLHSE